MKPTAIRSCLAVLMLLLFAFSITPRKVLHDIVANHKDSQATPASLNSDNSCLTKAGYNCQCDNLVVESPFLYSAHTVQLFTPVLFSSWQDASSYHYIFSETLAFGLRGPPAFYQS